MLPLHRTTRTSMVVIKTRFDITPRPPHVFTVFNFPVNTIRMNSLNNHSYTRVGERVAKRIWVQQWFYGEFSNRSCCKPWKQNASDRGTIRRDCCFRTTPVPAVDYKNEKKQWLALVELHHHNEFVSILNTRRAKFTRACIYIFCAYRPVMCGTCVPGLQRIVRLHQPN